MDKAEELYIFTLNNMIEKLKGKIKFRANNIDYDNLELFIEESSLSDININDFSISFQKQNGSFTLITNKILEINKKKRIIELLEHATGTDLFTSYNFSDMMDINVDHFVYDDNKIDFNNDILKQFENMNAILNLDIKKNKKQIL